MMVFSTISSAPGEGSSIYQNLAADGILVYAATFPVAELAVLSTIMHNRYSPVVKTGSWYMCLVAVVPPF